MNPYGSQPQSQTAINPALLGQYQPTYNAGINPSHLMNGLMPGNIPSNAPMQTLNPSQVLHSHQQQQQLGQIQQQRGLMNGGMNMLGMNIMPGMSPASPGSPQIMAGMNNTPMTATHLVAMGHHPTNQQSMMSSLHPMAYGRDPKMMMPQQQQQMHIPQQQQPQQQPQQQQQYDRPPSSSSIHSASNQQQMMPPPPRPPTAQSSRPGTAMDIRSRAPSSMAGGSPPANMAGMVLQPRPPSQPLENGIMSASGMYQPPSTPASMSPPPQQPGSPSPYRSGIQQNPMKRKMPDQSPIGMNMQAAPPPMNMMGMTQSQNLNGYTPPQIHAATQHQRSSPGPLVNAMNMAAMNGMGGVNSVNMGVSQQPPVGSMSGMPNFDLNSVMGMPMGMPQQTPTTPSQSQMMPQQIVGQPSMPDVQQPLRQGSLPPAISTPLSASPAKAPPTRLPSVAPSIPPATPTAGTSAEPSTPSAPVASSSTLPKANSPTTKITVVPLLGSDKTIPALDPEEISQIQDWMQVDKDYEGRYKKMKERFSEELRSETFGPLSVRWWEKGAVSTNPGHAMGIRPRTRENFDVRYVRKKERDAGRTRKPGRREGLKLPRTLDPTETNCPEQLVPIRLEFDVEHHRMRDTFVWNLNDPVVSPEHFAQTVVEDYNLSQSYHSIIAKSIHDQLNDFKAHSNNYDGEGGEFLLTESTLQTGNLDEQSAAWWEAWRKRLRSEYNARRTGKRGVAKRQKRPEEDHLPGEQSVSVHDIPLNEEAMFEDMRILIKLDVIVGSVKLDDQFEWDLDNTSASPEVFAEVYARELGLGGEFKTAIAHSIREQVQTYQKSLFLIGHASDEPIQDEDLKLSILPTLMSGTRTLDQVPSFTPLLNYLSDGEVERHEKERDKEMNRRKKRNTRGRRGIALPDREPLRTYRTPAIGFPELDAATQALATAAAAPARRAAAAAASVTIANMVASENGTPFLPQSVQPIPQPIPTIPKKKPKGLFKAPPVPPEALNPRALVAAPTSSTAADISALPPPLENDPPPSTTAAPIPRITITRRTKESEREAKEREFADGQHANFIDGVWHCSNCGCPESIAIGRRKGPLGEKSQCGTCGKYWHRHRRPRPVVYNTDPDFHKNLKRESEIAKTIAKKKGGVAALRAQSTTVPNTPEVPSEPQTPRVRDDDRAVSPVSTVSSGSEPPLAHKVEVNGNSVSGEPASEPSAAVVSPHEQGDQPPPATETLPPWLATAMQTTRLKYPNDRFGVTLRRVNAASAPEWRIKCSDCPGKLYKPGPGETLSNFEVHLKNRQHRQRVDERVHGGDP